MYDYAIIGAGAVGGLLASLLSQNKQQLCFVDSRLSQISSLELQVDSLEHGLICNKFKLYNRLPACRCLLVCVKAHQVKSALSSLVIPSNCKLMLVVNGMGAHHQVLETLSPQQLYLASNTHGALVQQKNKEKVNIQLKLKHTGLGQVVVGPYLKNAAKPEYFIKLEQALPSANWQSDIYPSLWLKLAINCCINPLTALHNCRNGELLSAEFQPAISALCQEVSQVAASEQIKLSAEELQQTVLQVASSTANNFSSMQQDIHHQRTSEINYINGYVVKQAAKHGIACPHNQHLLQQIQRLEKHND
jgi:2-dehydropantoate 2-reductase